MAVHDRAWRAYAGPLTPPRTRFLILPRYALGHVFRFRLFTAFFAACFVWPVASAVLIYLHHNLRALEFLELTPSKIIPIDASFFLFFLWLQGAMLGFLVAMIVGPALVSSDLRNNALPLYLSRPFTRTEYVAGKMSVLAILLSAITWIPGLLLFLLQGYLEGLGWVGANARIGGAILLASWIWIVLLSLLALSVSALVKWKPLASALLLGIFFVGGALATFINNVFETRWGNLINLGAMIGTAWEGLFGLAPSSGVPVAAAWASLGTICALCLLLLARKIRAYEVER